MPFNVTFASLRPQCPHPTITVTSGGSTTTGGTLYLALVGVNRCGVNRLSRLEDNTFEQITWTAGQKVVITIPDTARLVAEDVHRFILMGSDTGVASDFEPLAWWRGYDWQELSVGSGFYQEVQRGLPATIELTQDAHFLLGAVTTNPTSIAAIAAPLDGMRRWVTSLANYFYYDPQDTRTPNGIDILDAGLATGNWRPWIFPTDFQIGSVEDITGEYGCSRDVRLIDEADVLFPPPRYKMDGSNSNPVRYWVCNGYEESGAATESGTRITIEVTQNGQPKSLLFDKRLVAEVQGYVRQVTCALDTADITADTEFTYYYNRPLYTLEKDLLGGYAIALRISARFREEELGGRVSGTQLSMTPQIMAQAGDYVAGWKLLGNAIYNEGNRRRAFPLRGAKVRIGDGSGMVQRLEFELRSAFDLSLPVNNQTNLKITVNGNGDVFFRGTDPLTATEVTRAIVDMEQGRSNAGAWSSYTAVADGDQINVTCTYPTTVRADYPDVLAATNAGELNAPFVVVYVQRQSDGEIREFANNVVLPGANQVFSVTSFSAGTLITEIPTVEGNFGMFAASTSTLAPATGGAFTAANYRVAYAFRYNGYTATNISHAAIDGCIYEWDASIAELIELRKYWGPAAANFAALPTTDIPIGQVRETLDDKALYAWTGTAWLLISSKYWGPPVANFAALPGSGNPTGQVRLTLATGAMYRWNGSSWIPTGGSGGGIQAVTDADELVANTAPQPNQWAFLLTPIRTLVVYNSTSLKTHNGTTVWRPTHIASDAPGRWEMYQQPYYPNIVVAAGDVVTADGEVVTSN